MSYSIFEISEINPQDYPFYFFDCNVWIAQLQGSSEPRLQKYINFFEAVINLHSIKDVNLAKKIKNRPRIIVNTLLMSEIFNAYMRQVAMKAYYTLEFTKDGPKSAYEIKNYVNQHDYKKHYRLTGDFKDKLAKLKSDFIAYVDFIDFQDDGLNALDPVSLISSIGEDSDFNDYFYYYSFIEKGIPIVTDDNDFLFQDIIIITANEKLLKVLK